MQNNSTNTALLVNSSARFEGSQTRAASKALVNKLKTTGQLAQVIERDLSHGVELIDEDWINANFTNPAERSQEQLKRLAGSDRLVSELEAADTIIIGMPIYNFGPPAALKAWIDQVARAGRTFRYESSGPIGLLENKRAYLVVASGGTEIGSDIDFATDYLKHALSFIGISDTTVVTSDEFTFEAIAS